MDQTDGNRSSAGMDLFADAGRDTRGGTLGDGRDTIDVDKFQQQNEERAIYKELLGDTSHGQNLPR